MEDFKFEKMGKFLSNSDGMYFMKAQSFSNVRYGQEIKKNVESAPKSPFLPKYSLAVDFRIFITVS
ncbi:MAG: hypothetical protein JJU02_14415 [Cryomorphaceae bacterium]|nr:hypothetical protein [Cryomorphaceae bacterium]